MINRFLVALSVLCLVALSCVLPNLPTQNATSSPEPTFPPFSSLENAPKTPRGIIYVTAAETLYIRADHSHQAEVVGHLIHGEQVTVYECHGIWARVGAGRWVNSNFLSEACE